MLLGTLPYNYYYIISQLYISSIASARVPTDKTLKNITSGDIIKMTLHISNNDGIPAIPAVFDRNHVVGHT